MRCPNCGNIISINDKFCGYCGVELQKINQEEPDSVDIDTNTDSGIDSDIDTNTNVDVDVQVSTDTNVGNSINSNADIQEDIKGNDEVNFSNIITTSRKVLICILTLLLFIILFFIVSEGISKIFYADTSDKNIAVSDSDTDKKSNDNTVTLTSSAAPTSTLLTTSQPTTTPKATQVPTTEAPTPTKAPKTERATYLFNSDKEYITKAFLDSKTKDEIRLILNEMYARHGYIFNDSEYKAYFNRQTWYNPRCTSEFEAESYFNELERANKKTIVDYETSKGWR